MLYVIHCRENEEKVWVSYKQGGKSSCLSVWEYHPIYAVLSVSDFFVIHSTECKYGPLIDREFMSLHVFCNTCFYIVLTSIIDTANKIIDLFSPFLWIS